MSAQYLVSARKYRPQTFDTVVGQSHITTTLKNAIKSNHLAHAYLFCGPRGVGKTTCARILAKTINCERPTADTEACGTCETCVTFNENSSFNVFELDAASNNSVDDIRSLTEQVRFAPQIGKYKVYIIDEVHMLSAAAFNAFLKTLEEPPPYAIFILATTEKHKILPTILSRCQIFDFKRIQTNDIVAHLNDICTKENLSAEEAGLHIIAQKSEGCMRDALSIMDRISSFSNGNLTYEQTVEHLNLLDASFYFKQLDAVMSTDVASVLLQLESVYQRGFEGDAIINGFAEHLRDLLLCKDSKMTMLLDIPETHKRMFFEKAQMVSLEYLVSALNILNDAEINYKTTLNKRLHLEVTFIKLCYLNNVFDTSSLTEDAKKKYPSPIAEPVVPSAPVEAPQAKRQEVSPEKQPELPTPTEATVKTTPVASAAPAAADAIASTPPPIGPPKPKLGKGFLEQLQAQAASTVVPQETIVMTQALAEQLYAAYIEKLKNDSDKLLQATNLSNARIILNSPEEMMVLCNSNISLIYVVGNIDLFRDYCKQETHNKDLRVLAQLDPGAEKQAPKLQSISKTELFDMMVAQNPLLKQLKDQLRLDLG
ncbi:DNA polymerase III subunit gamma/tau [Taibaiella sp. KBW10]|uniref:DNA polymerase III subunit gamma/tau n=1 Tax=Taibaiella sp. KBW10 TaxID=2153357 RepID=UPI000F5A420A|nr:DNA polymerase III subunit gamma/tau [Taibaiella sp. KBW10]RQO31409.1 DNA polymerase III subunit gamma/tau [Taibaiella sp. KBW10]